MKTKSILLTLILFSIFYKCLAQTTTKNETFVLKGTLIGHHVDSVVIKYENSDGRYTVKSNAIRNNHFLLSGKIAHPISAHILFKNKHEVISGENEENRTKEFYIQPGTMTITGNPSDLKSLKIKGSQAQLEFEELQRQTASIRREMEPIDERMMREKDHDKAAEIREELSPYNAKIKKITYEFFKDHPNSYVTLNQVIYAMGSLSLDSIKAIYNGFNEEIKNTKEAGNIKSQIEQIEKGMPGRLAPVFSKTDIQGKALSLSDFKGKYVMLDFWASWCVPCRKGNPHMIALYNKYKDKGLEIIGIADDDGKPALWNAAVAKDGVGIWHHVLRGLNWDKIYKNIPNPNDVSEQYGIASLPTKILIGPDGKIIGRFGDAYGGSDDDMDKMLASIFDK